MLPRSENVKVCQSGCTEFAKREEDVHYSRPNGEKEIIKEIVHICLECGERYIKMGENHDIQIKYKKE